MFSIFVNERLYYQPNQK
ncbi:TPA: erythromycin resistance leader peptide [Streptococcus agalactiae]